MEIGYAPRPGKVGVKSAWEYSRRLLVTKSEQRPATEAHLAIDIETRPRYKTCEIGEQCNGEASASRSEGGASRRFPKKLISSQLDERIRVFGPHRAKNNQLVAQSNFT